MDQQDSGRSPVAENTGGDTAGTAGGIIDFRTRPEQYRHWRIEYDGPIARLYMDVDEGGGLFEGYELKLNSYDLGVDIELADIVQRMRFEHPEVGAVILGSGKDRVFCAGANIRMLGQSSHGHKVNFCKFTNETRNTFEAAGAESGQHYLAAVRGACAGGGYELALACEKIFLADDGSSSVALPEVPLLAVLPGTGGLTRVIDKRKVRRDLADVFCTLEEGVRGQRAKDWRLVDEVVRNTELEQRVTEAAGELSTGRPAVSGISLTPLARQIDADGSMRYSLLAVELDRAAGTATLVLQGPSDEHPVPADAQALSAQGADNWLLRLSREFDDAILHLRFNEPEIGVWLLKCTGDPDSVAAHEQRLFELKADDWLAKEILLGWQRVLSRLDMSARSLVALVEHGSCFSGLLAELLFAADRSYMMLDEFEGDDRPVAEISLSQANFGTLPMAHGVSRLANRFAGDAAGLVSLQQLYQTPLAAADALAHGLVTFACDDIDWFDEIRVFLEERTSFSADALTGMEANLRFHGAETMVTRIFGRLTAWQNWIFQRPNAVGDEGALKRYGSGRRPQFDRRRV